MLADMFVYQPPDTLQLWSQNKEFISEFPHSHRAWQVGRVKIVPLHFDSVTVTMCGRTETYFWFVYRVPKAHIRPEFLRSMQGQGEDAQPEQHDKQQAEPSRGIGSAGSGEPGATAPQRQYQKDIEENW
jgi:hypothetical protein